MGFTRFVRMTERSSTGFDNDRKMFGNKAANLLELKMVQHSNVRTPPFSLIECKYSKLRGRIVLDNYSMEGQTVAVRSSGVHSMPGMMQTILNVKYNDIPQAVEKVWDSYNSPECAAYREQHKYADTGTGVVVQTMVKNPIISGVVLTTDNSTRENKGVFNPIIEYVDGLGDSLVGGTAKATVMGPEHVHYQAIHKAVYNLFTKFGDLDIEFSVSEYGQLYILQKRSLVFPTVDPATIHESVGEALFDGVSIGCKGQVVVDLSGGDTDLVPHFDEFLPSHYKKMLEAKAMLTSVGGHHCHAAIVARAMGKIVISGVSYDTYANSLLGKRVILDGSSGIIYSVKDGSDASGLKVAESKLHTVHIPVDQRVPRTDMARELQNGGVELQADVMCALFYGNLDRFERGEITFEKLERVVRELCLILGTYYYAILCTEVRHARGANFEKPDNEDLKKWLDELSQRGVNVKGNSVTIRWDFFDLSVKQPSSIEEAVGIAELILKCYKHEYWRSRGGYGGKKWADITKLWLSYARGDLPPVLFLDACFNQQHNTGRVFGKYKWLSHGLRIGKLLDMRRVAPIQEAIKVVDSDYIMTNFEHNGLDYSAKELDKWLDWPCLSEERYKRYAYWTGQEVAGQEVTEQEVAAEAKAEETSASEIYKELVQGLEIIYGESSTLKTSEGAF